MGQQDEEKPGDSAAVLEYLRRAYDSNREWYKAAETTAQVLLGANGVFVGVVFGAILGRPSEARAVVSVFGVETWIFLSFAIVAIVGAVLCAAQTMWSLHGVFRSKNSPYYWNRKMGLLDASRRPCGISATVGALIPMLRAGASKR